MLERTSEFLDERRAQVWIDRRAGSSYPETQRAKLLRAVVPAVVVDVVEVVFSEVVAAGIRRRKRVGEIVVIPAIEALQHGMALSRDIVGETQTNACIRRAKEISSVDCADRRGDTVCDNRPARARGVGHALIVDTRARGDAEAARRRPSILRVARVMQVHVRGSRPCRSVIRRCAHVDETYANRSAIYSPVLDCSGRAVRARPNPVIYR